MENKFEMPEAEVLMFDQDDVIVTSVENENDGEWDIV